MLGTVQTLDEAGHFPRAEEEALRALTEIKDSRHQYGALGEEAVTANWVG